MSEQRLEFGSYAGIDGLRVLLHEQSLIVKELVRHLDEPTTFSSAALLDALGEDLKSCGLLSRTLKVNQLLLLNRVVIRRAILSVYLLWHKSKFSASIGSSGEEPKSSGPTPSKDMVEALLEAAKDYRGEIVASHELPTIWEQIDALESVLE